ncbi:MAG: aldehyde dehydrogenase family protein [Enterobacterales bacterium]|nr:aldehyde dehydrogenase family protein [Enterobacterales bacterium]
MTQEFNCISPIDGSIYTKRQYTAPSAMADHLQKAVQVQKQWAKTPLKQRQSICSAAIDHLVANKETLATEICWQMGRPIAFAAGEINGLEERARKMIELSDEALARIKIPQKQGFERWIQRDPVGVVLIIAPWNYPYLTAINSLVPALLAGNSVLLKHSAQTPLVSERLAEAFTAAGLPDGLLQALHLTHDATEQLIQSSKVNYIAFTGSTKGGAIIEQAAVGRFVKLGLELGGKDPAYVRADADLEVAVETTMDGAFFNSGQSCCGIERIYVADPIYDDFLAKAIAWVNQLKLGRSDETKTTLGPMVNQKAADFVRGQIKQACKQGAMTHIDEINFPMDTGNSAYLMPQILTQVDHSMSLMMDESFGPVIGIQKVASDQEAVMLINDSPFGLTASIFTQDLSHGIELGQSIESGTFFINRCDYLDPELAWTGVKDSGSGCSLSVLGFDAVTQPKSFHIKQI